jgi:hypothetical protein
LIKRWRSRCRFFLARHVSMNWVHCQGLAWQIIMTSRSRYLPSHMASTSANQKLLNPESHLPNKCRRSSQKTKISPSKQQKNKEKFPMGLYFPFFTAWVTRTAGFPVFYPFFTWKYLTESFSLSFVLFFFFFFESSSSAPCYCHPPRPRKARYLHCRIFGHPVWALGFGKRLNAANLTIYFTRKLLFWYIRLLRQRG